jgi:4-hydroxybutyrate CoA-transferase
LRQKTVTAEKAVSVIKSGSRVVIGHACGEPQVLVESMVNRADCLTDVEIVHMVSMGKARYCEPEFQKAFRHNSFFAGNTTRKAIKSGQADYTPCFLHQIPRLFKENILPVDVALVQVSKPDNHGYCSFGISVDYTKPAAAAAKIIIAEMNQKMPRTYGDTFIHVTEIDYLVETDYPLIELPPPHISKVEEKIGQNVAEIIENGSTLQMGIGAIPDAVLAFLKDKCDLGIHTEMFSDGVLDLIAAGVINNQKKTFHHGKIVASFLMGTPRLYEFVHENPMVEMYPADYTNNPCIIAKNNKMVAINSALQVDLTGQVCADTIGHMQYSGVGGQVDYVRGAMLSPGGKSIIALPSTAKGGSISRIVCQLDQGAAVTTSRNDVHFIVTEHGVADLRGKTIKQRAQELIRIAHPDFQAQLLDSWMLFK